MTIEEFRKAMQPRVDNPTAACTQEDVEEDIREAIAFAKGDESRLSKFLQMIADMPYICY